MPAPRKYPQELRERSVRLVREAMAEDPGLSVNQAVHRVGTRVGVVPDTLRGWVKQARVDAGEYPGTTTSSSRRLTSGRSASPLAAAWLACTSSYDPAYVSRRPAGTSARGADGGVVESKVVIPTTGIGLVSSGPTMRRVTWMPEPRHPDVDQQDIGTQRV